MNKFLQMTGKDLSVLLVSYINSFIKSGRDEGSTTLDRLESLGQITDSVTASKALHCLIANDSVSLDDVQDGMFRSGLVENEDSCEDCQPWPLVMASVAFEINDQMNSIKGVKKKADT